MKAIINTKQNKVYLKYFALCLVFFAFAFITLPKGGHKGDTLSWLNWTTYIFENGIGKIYETQTGYLPLFHYVLLVFGYLQGSVESIAQNRHYIKITVLFFHFISGFFLLKLLKTDNNSWTDALVNSLFFVLNIAILYNSIIWGQVDGILTCFVFITFYFAYKKKVHAALIFMLLALNFKLQAIVFVPPIALMLLPQMVKSISFKKMATWLVSLTALQVLILLPFILAGTIGGLYNALFGLVDLYPIVSMDAFNFWELVVAGDLRFIPDTTTAIGLSYKTWGLLLFFSFSLLALSPLLISVYKQIVKKLKTNLSLDQLLLIFALIALLFFFFNTQMHERYSHPAFIFLVAYAILQRKPMLGIMGCFAYFLNLDAVIKSIPFQNYDVFIYSHNFIAVLYGCTIVWLFVLLLKPLVLRKS